MIEVTVTATSGSRPSALEGSRRLPGNPCSWALLVATFCFALGLSGRASQAADWPQFRGPAGQGISSDGKPPLAWGPEKNLRWKTELPGPGASSPVVVGARVYLTCQTGSPRAASSSGEDALKRHVLCLDLESGKILWTSPFPAELPEQEKIREDHGYATSTLLVDRGRLFAFFGKSGVFALDLQGKELWHTEVGSGLNGWGSATSPVAYKDLIIVNASVESEALVALHRDTGKEVWRAGGIQESWNTPILVSVGGKTELVVARNEKVLGFDPDTGKQLWSCGTEIGWYMCPGLVAAEGIVYAVGGRSGGAALAVRAGGRGDVTKTHRLWRLGKCTNVPSPILHEGHLYFVQDNQGIAYCVEAKSGKLVYEQRLSPAPGMFYASPVLADGKLYCLTREGEMVILAAKTTFEELGRNQLERRGMFNASPAVVGKRLILRSNRYVYCVGES